MKNMIKCRAETTVNLNTQARMNLSNKLSVEVGRCTTVRGIQEPITYPQIENSKRKFNTKRILLNFFVLFKYFL